MTQTFQRGDVMAQLQACASIFQLAFGLNAVMPAVFFAYKRTHEKITMRFAKEVQVQAPELKFDEYELIAFRRFVRGMSTGLKFADRVKYLPITLFFIAVVLSFFGLVYGAIRPEGKLDDGLVWGFSIFALLISPLLGLGYEWFLGYLERAVLLSWAESPEAAAEVAAHFKLSLTSAREIDELAKSVREAAVRVDKFSEDMARFRWKQEYRRWKLEYIRRKLELREKLVSWFR
jgi:hypothetical protein